MKEPPQRGKSPIDFKRDSGGSFTVGQEGDIPICMIVVNDRMPLVTTNAVYEANMQTALIPIGQISTFRIA